METKASKKLTALFSDRASAQAAFEYLHEKGYEPDTVNLIMSESARNTHFRDIEHYTEKGTKAVENAAIGSLIGGTVTAVATIGISIFVPGLGLFIGGPLAAGLIGGSAGVITGGICGALIGADIPVEKAKVYEAGIQDGKIFFMVEPKNEADGRAIEENWMHNQGEEIHW